MPHFEDDEPPIKTHPASKEYRDNFDRTFGDEDAIEARVGAYGWWCQVCKAHVLDPENHAAHGVIKLEDGDEEPEL